jgi:hypothetical protein
VKLLEIGMGCNMQYGPGASAKIWTKVFPRGDIWLADVDKKCAEKYWNASMGWRYVIGDQSSEPVLASWLKETGGNFDYIIDDGGHSNTQIWNSFQYLFVHALKPGGVYFVEDLQTARLPFYFDRGIPGHPGSFMPDFMSDAVQYLLQSTIRGHERWRPFVFKENHDIVRVDCIAEMCAITKKK